MKPKDWLTSPKLIQALGSFDLDPCCPPKMPWITASRMLTFVEDGLRQDWPRGARIWLNPPSENREEWLKKLIRQGNGIVLLPAHTETEMFFRMVWGIADAICFIRGRL